MNTPSRNIDIADLYIHTYTFTKKSIYSISFFINFFCVADVENMNEFAGNASTL